MEDNVDTPQPDKGEVQVDKNVELDNKTKKKSSTKKPAPSKNSTVETQPTLNEAKKATVVLGWGRMNPVTVGHEKLANKIKEVARKNKATPVMYLTHSQDAKKNPLSYSDKVMLAQKAFGNIVKSSQAKTIIQAMVELQKDFSDVILVVGQDRVKEFETLLNKYNGKDYKFDNIDIVSAGDRDPDAEGVEGMSASKMRAAAAAGEKDAFISGLPRKLKRDGEDIYDMVRSGMKIAEELETEGLLDEAVLNLVQRRKRAMVMRKYKNKIKMARERMKRRMPTNDRVAKIAQKRARNIVKQKIMGKMGGSYDSLDNAQKMMIDKRVEKKSAMIKKLAKRLLPQIKRELMKKKSNMNVNEELEVILETTAPVKRFHEARKKDGSIKLDKRFRAFRNAAKPVEEGKNVDAARSEIQKEREALKREHERELRDAKIADARVTKSEATEVRQDDDVEDRKGTQPAKYHSGLSKSTKEKRDAHFKKGAKMDDNNSDAYKPAPGDAEAKTKESEYTKKYKQMYGEEVDFENDVELLNMVEEIASEIYESIELDEAKTESALQKKADKSGISYGVLKKVYDRGVAAWRTGHRPGTTPAQWGMARVNSFITGGKTRTTADVDLAKGLRKEEVELEEVLKVSDGMEAWIKDFQDSDAPQFDGKSKEKRREMAIAAFYNAKGETKEEVELDSFLDLNESFELVEASILDKALAAIHKHVSGGVELGDIAYQVSRARGVDMTGRELEKAYVKKYGEPEKTRKYDPATIARLKKKFGFKEEGGAGDYGTDKLTKKYKKDTPCEEIQEDAGTPAHHLGIKSNFKHMLKHAVTHVDYDMDGDVDADDFKKTVPDEITGAEKKDLTKAAFKKYADEKKHTRKGVAFESVNEEFETLMEDKCDLIGMKQIKDFERFVDRMFEKFGIDFNFTKHFGERMSDGRNDPCITMKELANFITKIYKNQGKSLKSVAGAEAVIKDIQSDLNIPVAVKYDNNNDEFDVVMKTIMRKKNFKTPNKVIKY